MWIGGPVKRGGSEPPPRLTTGPRGEVAKGCPKCRQPIYILIVIIYVGIYIVTMSYMLLSFFGEHAGSRSFTMEVPENEKSYTRSIAPLPPAQMRSPWLHMPIRASFHCSKNVRSSPSTKPLSILTSKHWGWRSTGCVWSVGGRPRIPSLTT